MSKIRARNGVIRKLCSTCKVWKPLTDFSPGGETHRRGTEGGVHCECRSCNAGRHRHRYAEAKPIREALKNAVPKPVAGAKHFVE